MSNDSMNSNRRQFLKLTGLGVAGLLVADKVFAQKPAAPAAAKLEMAKESDPTAVALGYIEDASKVDTKKWPKRAGAEGAKQFCYNCQFYKDKCADPKATAASPCSILANKGVTAKGWCNSWVSGGCK